MLGHGNVVYGVHPSNQEQEDIETHCSDHAHTRLPYLATQNKAPNGHRPSVRPLQYIPYLGFVELRRHWPTPMVHLRML